MKVGFLVSSCNVYKKYYNKFKEILLTIFQVQGTLEMCLGNVPKKYYNKNIDILNRQVRLT